jgi:hypothetical protein
VYGHPLGIIPGCKFFGGASLYTEPEYKQHKLEVCSTEAKNGGWGVEVTVSWQDGITEKRTKYGPYQGFISPVDAQSWGIIRCINWIDLGKVEPSAFISLPTAQLQQDLDLSASPAALRLRALRPAI